MAPRYLLILVPTFVLAAVVIGAPAPPPPEVAPEAPTTQPAADASAVGTVQCANLIYADNKTSVCFAEHFLTQIGEETHIVAHPRFTAVKVESAELYNFPFAVMTGEGAFTLSEGQRTSLRNYLIGGGFVVASAGCSSDPWNASFRQAIKAVFPDVALTPIAADHPLFHTVYDIQGVATKRAGPPAQLEGLEIDGRIVLVYAADGLNDTANAGGQCCCCGGNEIANAREINVNLLAYALTH